MKDETGNFIGYSQMSTLGIGDSNMTTSVLGLSGNATTTINYDWNLHNGNNTIYSNGSEYNSLSTLITNQNNMVRQVKAAVFTVERNEDNKVTSAKLYGEFWVEVKNGSSLDLAVAKHLDNNFDPTTTVVREIYSVTF